MSTKQPGQSPASSPASSAPSPTSDQTTAHLQETPGALMASPFDLGVIGEGLPVAECLPKFFDSLGQGRVVVQAPPGTGKTTLLPPAAANLLAQRAAEEETPVEGRTQVYVVAPRRVAVRAAARRLAYLSGTQLGHSDSLVGFQVRGESHPGRAVTFMTPGVLIRKILADPELPGVGAIIIDEVHERQLDTDVALALALEAADLTGEIAVAAMSATIDAQRFALLLQGTSADPVPVVDSPAILHDVKVIYRPHPERLMGSRDFWRHVAGIAAEQFHQCAADGYSVLVFVPGAREVEFVQGHLRSLLAGTSPVAADGSAADLPVFPLHGRLPAAAQDAALQSTDPRIVVSTAVAESSITVPGVRVVVDAGLSRAPRRDSQRDMSGLVTVSASKPAAIQRAGRAGREGPGRVVRCYAEHDFTHFAATITPEIATSDLTSMVLLWAVWGTPRAEGLSLLVAPPARAVASAEESLRTIGAVDGQGRATASGELLAQFPVDPRVAHAVLVLGEGAADVAAILGSDPRGDLDQESTSRAAVSRDDYSIRLLAKRLRRISAQHTDDYVRLVREQLGDDFLPTDWLEELRNPQGAPQDKHTRDERTRGERTRDQRTRANVIPAGIVTAVAFPQRIARRVNGSNGNQQPASQKSSQRSSQGSSQGSMSAHGQGVSEDHKDAVFLSAGASRTTSASRTSSASHGASGTRVRLDKSLTLGDSQWIAIASVDRVDGAKASGAKAGTANASKANNLPVVRAAARLEEKDALAILGTTTTTTAVVDPATGAVTGREVTRAGSIELSSRPVSLAGDDIAQAVLDALSTHGLDVLPQAHDERFLAAVARLRWAHEHIGGLWPDVTELVTAPAAAEWLEMDVVGIRRAGDIDLLRALTRIVPWQYANIQDDLLPTTWVAPSGRSIPIDYSGDIPSVAIKLQECFGLTEHPVIGATAHLADPAASDPAADAIAASDTAADAITAGDTAEGTQWKQSPGVPLQVQLLSPAGRPIAITADLPGFFTGSYHAVKKEMMGRYPKHPWPEDPMTATATHLTKNRLAQ